MRIKRTRKKTAGRNSGFTLLELLLVMAILVVLASLSGFAIIGMQKNALTKAAFIEIQSLEKACTAYRLNVGTFPQKLDDLYEPPNGLSRTKWGGPFLEKPVKADPWQRAYTYTPDEVQGKVVIRSAGPDGQAGTEDDVDTQG